MSPRPFHFQTVAKALIPLVVASIIGFLSSCSAPTGNTMTVVQTRGYQQNYGPFDHNGNYVESWADKSPKRNYVTRDQYAKLNKKSRKSKRKPTVAPIPRPQPIYNPEPRYVSHTPKPAVVRPRTTASKPKVSSRPKTASRPKTTSRTKTVARRKPTTRPKPKSVAVKPKAKPPIVHKVKKGDTLYGLSRKYKTSIGSIQRSNKLNTTHIGIGQRLIIPRK